MVDVPVHDSVDVLATETIFQTDEWWKAVVKCERYGDTEVCVYLWHNDGETWTRKQKYAAKDSDEWQQVRAAVDAFMH